MGPFPTREEADGLLSKLQEQTANAITKLNEAVTSAYQRWQKAADERREDLARGEITMSFTTKDMATLGGDNADPDILDLKPGSPILIEFRTDAEDGTISKRLEFEKMSRGEIMRTLTSKGVNDEVAAALTDYFQDARYTVQHTSTWYVRSVEMTLDGESGFNAQVEACNYFWNGDVPSLKETRSL